MLARVKRTLTYANAMSTIAVFLALGGATYAATALPAGSVGTRQLRDFAVTPAKLSALARRAGAVTSLAPELARIDRVASAKPAFGAPSGTSVAAVSPDLIQEQSPAAPITASDLDVYAWDTTNGLIGDDVVVTLYLGPRGNEAAPTALSCKTSNLGVCSNTIDKIVVPAGSYLAFRVTNPAFNGFPLDAQIGWEASG